MPKKNIMIKCPQTGKPFATGLFVGPNGDFKTLGFYGMSAACPHCGQDHVWSTKDAWVEAKGAP